MTDTSNPWSAITLNFNKVLFPMMIWMIACLVVLLFSFVATWGCVAMH